MRHISFSLAFIVFLPMLAKGTETHTSIFRCETENKKIIEVYKVKNMVTYSFGRDGRPPELNLTTSITDVDISIGEISGNELSNSIAFSNGDYTYVVKSTVNRVTEIQEPKHGVLVKKKSKYMTYIACIPGSDQGSLLDLE
ncbi:hypothetical protein [Pseudomonas lopnurensis]|uniref:hypothetical protein n=1 Tax=Pseudomonas lopnurensis TaxID=1477517 RepID=UPI0028AD2030|nr:hypothetical protein [Pseudomonas lopnurensis]